MTVDDAATLRYAIAAAIGLADDARADLVAALLQQALDTLPTG